MKFPNERYTLSELEERVKIVEKANYYLRAAMTETVNNLKLSLSAPIEKMDETEVLSFVQRLDSKPVIARNAEDEKIGEPVPPLQGADYLRAAIDVIVSELENLFLDDEMKSATITRHELEAIQEFRKL